MRALMASPPPTKMPRAKPRIYLMTPPVTEPARLQGPLETALGAADIAALLLTLTSTDERTMIDHVKALATLVQDKNVALLVDRPNIVARAGADGAHVPGVGELKNAIE